MGSVHGWSDLAFALSCIHAAVVLPDGAIRSGRDALRSSVESRD